MEPLYRMMGSYEEEIEAAKVSAKSLAISPLINNKRPINKAHPYLEYAVVSALSFLS